MNCLSYRTLSTSLSSAMRDYGLSLHIQAYSSGVALSLTYLWEIESYGEWHLSTLPWCSEPSASSQGKNRHSPHA
jgi:hypothetical protein